MRTEYKFSLLINNISINKVIIDQHYKENHPEMSDELILKLVKELDGGNFPIEDEKGDFMYFKAEPVEIDDKPYRIIFLLCQYEDYLGVINAFRVRRKND